MDNNRTNIEEYYETVKDMYDVDFTEFNIICRTPFKFVKRIMNSGVLKDIRLKYFGVFKVAPSRVSYSKKRIKENLKKGVISQEKYDKKMEILNNYVREN